MEQLGTDFNATGSVMSRAELEDQRRKRGECVSCGRKCFQKKIFKMIPITDHGRVLNGRCLNCHPLDVNDGALPAVSRPATKADLARFTRSQNNLRQSISVSSSSHSVPEEQRPSSRRRGSIDHSRSTSTSRNGSRRPGPAGGNRGQSVSSRSIQLRNPSPQSSNEFTVSNETSSVTPRPPSASRSMDNINTRGQDSGVMPPGARPTFSRPNSNRSMSAGSYYSARSQGSRDAASIRSGSQRPSYGTEQDDTTEEYDDCDNRMSMNRQSLNRQSLNRQSLYDDNNNNNNHQGVSSTEQALREAQEFARQFADDSESADMDEPIPLLRSTMPPTHASALDYYNQRSNHGVNNREISVRSLQSNGSRASRENSIDWGRGGEQQRSLGRSAHRRPSDESLGARSLDGGMKRSFHSASNSVGSLPRGRPNRDYSSDRSLDSDTSFGEDPVDPHHVEYQVKVPQSLSTNEIALSNSNEDAASRTSSRSSSDPEQYPGNTNHSSPLHGPAGAGMEPPPLQRLRDAGGDVVDILNCMRDYPDSPDVQAIGLQTISDMELSEEDGAMLANIGIVQVVLGAMDRFRDDLDLQVFGCRTIWSITGTADNQRVLVEGGALNVLQQTMSHFLGDFELQEQALAVIANIAAVEANVGPLLEAGTMERLVEAMNKHAGNGEVQVKGCLAMANLASHPSAPKQQLVEAGGGSAVVISMVMHPTNPELQEKALRALRNLTANCEHNRVELTNIGGIDAIISAMQVHRDSAGVQEIGAWTLSNLAGNADSRVLIGDCGGVDVIVRAMWVHSDKTSVQEWCARALYSLSMDPHNGAMILDVGGISAIVNAMQAHVDSPAVQETGCAVLCGLAFDQQSKMRIVDEEALDAVVLAMVLHGEDAAVNERACRLLLQLSIAENFKAMQASNVGELVRAAAQKFPDSCGEPAEELIHVIEGFISEYL